MNQSLVFLFPMLLNKEKTSWLQPAWHKSFMLPMHVALATRCIFLLSIISLHRLSLAIVNLMGVNASPFYSSFAHPSCTPPMLSEQRSLSPFFLSNKPSHSWFPLSLFVLPVEPDLSKAFLCHSKKRSTGNAGSRFLSSWAWPSCCYLLDWSSVLMCTPTFSRQI